MKYLSMKFALKNIYLTMHYKNEEGVIKNLKNFK